MAFYSTSIEQLPALDRSSREHSDRVFAHLLELIEGNQGFIGFDRYMQGVLYAPGLGYYSAGSQKFGEQGDYVTAPLISPLFSQTLARYINKHSIAGDSILELGGGTGKMAADILTELATQVSKIDSYSILEPSADLRDRQQQTLASVAPVQAGQVAWLDRLSMEQGFRGVVVANEVLDAMPV